MNRGRRRGLVPSRDENANTCAYHAPDFPFVMENPMKLLPCTVIVRHKLCENPCVPPGAKPVTASRSDSSPFSLRKPFTNGVLVFIGSRTLFRSPRFRLVGLRVLVTNVFVLSLPKFGREFARQLPLCAGCRYLGRLTPAAKVFAKVFDPRELFTGHFGFSSSRSLVTRLPCALGF